MTKLLKLRTNVTICDGWTDCLSGKHGVIKGLAGDFPGLGQMYIVEMDGLISEEVPYTSTIIARKFLKELAPTMNFQEAREMMEARIHVRRPHWVEGHTVVIEDAEFIEYRRKELPRRVDLSFADIDATDWEEAH